MLILKQKNQTFLYASLLTLAKEFIFKSGNLPGNDANLMSDEGCFFNESGKFFKNTNVGRLDVGEKSYTTVVVYDDNHVKPQILKFVVLPSVEEWSTRLSGCVNNAEDFLEMGTLLVSLGSNLTFASDGRSLIVTQSTLNDLCHSRRENFFQGRHQLLTFFAGDPKDAMLRDENRVNFLKLTHEKVLTQYSRISLYRLPVPIQRFLREKFSMNNELFQNAFIQPKYLSGSTRRVEFTAGVGMEPWLGSVEPYKKFLNIVARTSSDIPAFGYKQELDYKQEVQHPSTKPVFLTPNRERIPLQIRKWWNQSNTLRGVISTYYTSTSVKDNNDTMFFKRSPSLRNHYCNNNVTTGEQIVVSNGNNSNNLKDQNGVALDSKKSTVQRWWATHKPAILLTAYSLSGCLLLSRIFGG